MFTGRLREGDGGIEGNSRGWRRGICGMLEGLNGGLCGGCLEVGVTQ